jgi:hypothetical protein
LRIAGHFLSDSNNSVRIDQSQAIFEICKNDAHRRVPGKTLWIRDFRLVRLPGLRNHWMLHQRFRKPGFGPQAAC